MSVAPTASHLRDDALPAFHHLLGDGVGELLVTAARAAFGAAELIECRPVQTSWRPGRSLAVRYQLRFEDQRGPREEALVAYTATKVPARSVRLTSDDGEVAIWRIADDPWLPGLQPVDVDEFIEDIAAKAEALGVREWIIEMNTPVVMLADRQRLTQAMMNLCRNAVEHTPEGIAVWIGSRLAGDLCPSGSRTRARG
jgi:hypothetical protein